MENRFDDVESRIVEEPEGPRAPRRQFRAGPALLAVTAAVSLLGSLAAGASALTSAAQAPARTAAPAGHVAKQGQRHGLCEKRRRSMSAVRY